MDNVIRPALPEDEPFLWEMLYYAAHMNEEVGVLALDAKHNPDLRHYVSGWGRDNDVGVIAISTDHKIGAAWVRLLLGQEKTIAYLDDTTGELAVAVHPDHAGKGVGTALLRSVLEAARPIYPAISLSVRAGNPAKRLYERLGFQVVRESHNRVGGRSYVMTIALR